MSSDVEEEDIYAVSNLVCTICQHDLNHTIYLLCEHPLLPVPLCVVCHDQVQQSDIVDVSADVSEFCSWCGDGGDLLLCSDEANCNRAFCKECLRTNLGEDCVTAIESSDEWSCLCCNSSVLSRFTDALHTGRQNSVYNQPISEIGRDVPTDDSEAAEEEREVARDLYILRSIVREADIASSNLENEARTEKLGQIRDELRSTQQDPSMSVHEKAAEELESWVQHWERHFDILQVQEAALFEKLYSLGYDPRQFSEYDASDEALAAKLTAREKDAKRSAEAALASQTIASPTKAHRLFSDDAQSSGTSALEVPYSQGGPTSQPARTSQSTPKAVEWTEDVVEVDAENKLPEYELAVQGDEVVARYSGEGFPDIDSTRYPASFEAVLPRAVIHAYYYARAADRKMLAERYNIAPHIRIILAMLSAHADFPRSTDRWSFAATVHPAVRLALFYTESSAQRAVLCEHYNLSDEYSQITDFGSTQDVLRTYETVVAEHNKRSGQEQDQGQGPARKSKLQWMKMRDVEDEEEANDKALFGEYFPSENVSGTARKCTCSGAESADATATRCSVCLKKEKVRKLLTPVMTDDAKDEVKCEKERRRLIHQITGVKPARSAEYTQRRAEKRGRVDARDGSSPADAARLATANPAPQAPINADVGGTVAGGSGDNAGDASAPAGEPMVVEAVAKEVSSTPAPMPITAALETAVMPTRKNALAESAVPVPLRAGAGAAAIPATPAAAAVTEVPHGLAQKGSQLVMVTDFCDSDEEVVYMATVAAPSVPSVPPASSAQKSGRRSSLSESPAGPFSEGFERPGDAPAGDIVDVTVEEPAASSSGAVPAKFVPKLPPQGKVPRPQSVSRGILKLEPGTTQGPSEPKKRSIVTLSSYFQASPAGQRGGSSDPAAPKAKPAENDDSEFEEDWDSGSEDDAEDPQNEADGADADPAAGPSGKKRRNPPKKRKRLQMKRAALEAETLKAKKEEKERLRELALNKLYDSDSGFALNSERPAGDKAVIVTDQLATCLKEHQKEGVRFLWKNVFGSLSRASRDAKSGSGCIIAHCMGLGKTLTVIAFTSTLLTNPVMLGTADPYVEEGKGSATSTAVVSAVSASAAAGDTAASTGTAAEGVAGETRAELSTAVTSAALPAADAARAPPVPLQDSLAAPVKKKPLIHTILVVAPVNTLENWRLEYQRWVPPEMHLALNVISLTRDTGDKVNLWGERRNKMRRWHTEGGILIVGYDMYRLLTNLDKKSVSPEDLENIREARRYLQNPGPDLVVADEAHTIKEKTSKISAMMNEIRTKRRIALTGSPLQNNLMEYWCMINWVKHRFLGNFKEFRQYYVVPIREGSTKGAVKTQVRKMKARTHLLNRKLQPIVDRKDTRVLERDLLPKREFVISIKMTDFQKYLYKTFLTLLSELVTGSKLMVGYHGLNRIWNHPGCMIMSYQKDTGKEELAAWKVSTTAVSSTAASSGATTAAIVTAPVAATEVPAKTSIPSAAALEGSGPSPVEGTTSSGAETVAAIAPKLPAAPQRTLASALRPAVAKPKQQKCSLQYIREQLDSTLRHFRLNSMQLLADVEASSSQVEGAILRGGDDRNDSSKGGASASARSELIVVDDSDDDNGAGEEKSRDRRRNSKRRRSSGGTGTIENSSASESESDSDLSGFVVADDVVEYEDTDNSDEDFLPGPAKNNKRRRLMRKSKALAPAKKRYVDDTDSSSLASAAGDAAQDDAAAVAELGSKYPRTQCSSPEMDEADEASGAQPEPNTPAMLDAGATIPASVEKQAELEAARLLRRAAEARDSSPSATSPRDPRQSAVGIESGEDSPSNGRPAGRGNGNAPPSALEEVLARVDAADAQDEAVLEEAEEIIRNTIRPDWWRQGSASDGAQGGVAGLELKEYDLLQLGSKMVALLSLIALSVLQGDKVLVFSHSIYSLDCIELFLGMKNWGRLIDSVQARRHERHSFTEWGLGKQYLRIDGSSKRRQSTIDMFNKPKAPYHLMLVSTKAGNMGVNLQAANRVIIFDTSWNPVHDLQAMYRAYRYGQVKPVFVYRLLSAGSMEERIYRLQVKKQSLSARVVDDQMPDNHFNDEELMTFEDCENSECIENAQRVLQKEGCVEDKVLSEFVRYFGSAMLTSIEDHGGLLEDNIDEHLNEEEQKEAQEDLEKEMGRAAADLKLEQAVLAAVMATSDSAGAAASSIAAGVVTAAVRMPQSSAAPSASAQPSDPFLELAGQVNFNPDASRYSAFVKQTGGQQELHRQQLQQQQERRQQQSQLQLQQQLQQQRQQQLALQQQQLRQQIQSIPQARFHTLGGEMGNFQIPAGLLGAKANAIGGGRPNPQQQADPNLLQHNYVLTPTNAFQGPSMQPLPGIPTGPGMHPNHPPVSQTAPGGNGMRTNGMPQPGYASAGRPQMQVPAQEAQALRTKEDILIVFASEVAPDPTYATTQQLLSSRLAGVYRTQAELAARHRELQRSGRAMELLQLPQVRHAVETARRERQQTQQTQLQAQQQAQQQRQQPPPQPPQPPHPR